MANRPNENAAVPGASAAKDYGKIDSDKSRDIMTEVGKSKGKENNSADFGNDSQKSRDVNQKAEESRSDAQEKSSSVDPPPIERQRESQLERAPAETPRKYPS